MLKIYIEVRKVPNRGFRSTKLEDLLSNKETPPQTPERHSRQAKDKDIESQLYLLSNGSLKIRGMLNRL